MSHEMAHLSRRPGRGARRRRGTPGQARIADPVVAALVSLRRAALCCAGRKRRCPALHLHSRGELPTSEWLGVWMVMVLSTATNLQPAPAPACCGRLRPDRAGRASQTGAIDGRMPARLWLALVGHLGLWAACFVPLASAALTAYWMRSSGVVYQSLRVRTVQDAGAFDWKA
ncbi:MAG: hypothetical protein MZW92_58765 [Comamonadaceae bacterium]|nr:hypothetical protein [Comamonadaceae bacterium]